jgi:hypothetical protein
MTTTSKKSRPSSRASLIEEAAVPARKSKKPQALVFEKGAFSELVAELKSLGERSGSALGDVYARAASSFLHRTERFQDLNAERRYRQQKRAKPAAKAPSVPRAVTPKQISSTHK